MKKFLTIAITFVLMLGCVFMSACSEKSNATYDEELIRKNYAKEMEAEHDKTRVHPVEIPDNAQTVEVDGIIYDVFRDSSIYDAIWRFTNHPETYSGTGNFILANDIQWMGMYNYYDIGSKSHPFNGRFYGNNYKIKDCYSAIESGIFTYIENAVIQNVIFSASQGDYQKTSRFANTLVNYAKNSVIKDCINYFQEDSACYNSTFKKSSREGHFIGTVVDCEIIGCENYADRVFNYNGGMVITAYGDTIISGCKNYGNFVRRPERIREYDTIEYEAYNDNDDKYAIGGIAGEIYGNVKVKDCVNYGHIAGLTRMGGIVGSAVDLDIANTIGSYYWINYFIAGGSYTEDYNVQSASNYWANQVIENCVNYGNIYLNKTAEKDNKIKNVFNSYFTNDVYCIGGIAGSATKVINCENYGNFNGFESFDEGINVDYCGGIVGFTVQADNCTNTGTMVIQKGKASNVGNIYGFLIGN